MNAQVAIALVDTLSKAIAARPAYVVLDRDNSHFQLSRSGKIIHRGTQLRGHVNLSSGYCDELHESLPAGVLKQFRLSTQQVSATGMEYFLSELHESVCDTVDEHLHRCHTQLLLEDDEKQQLVLEITSVSRQALHSELKNIPVCPSVSVAGRRSFTSRFAHRALLSDLLPASILDAAAEDATAYPDPAGDLVEKENEGYKPGDYGFITGA